MILTHVVIYEGSSNTKSDNDYNGFMSWYQLQPTELSPLLGQEQWVVGSILHGVDPLSYFSFQPVLHDWCNKGCGMCYLVCWMMHIKGARCSSVVRAFAHGAMGRRIDPPWCGPIELFLVPASAPRLV